MILYYKGTGSAPSIVTDIRFQKRGGESVVISGQTITAYRDKEKVEGKWKGVLLDQGGDTKELTISELKNLLGDDVLIDKISLKVEESGSDEEEFRPALGDFSLQKIQLEDVTGSFSIVLQE